MEASLAPCVRPLADEKAAETHALIALKQAKAPDVTLTSDDIEVVKSYYVDGALKAETPARKISKDFFDDVMTPKTTPKTK